MKHFQLADANFRKSVDLTFYEEDICDAVNTVKPGTQVIVAPDHFTTIPELGKVESIQVSRLLRQGELKDYTMYRPCLFNSYQRVNKSQEMEE